MNEVVHDCIEGLLEFHGVVFYEFCKIVVRNNDHVFHVAHPLSLFMQNRLEFIMKLAFNV